MSKRLKMAVVRHLYDRRGWITGEVLSCKHRFIYARARRPEDKRGLKTARRCGECVGDGNFETRAKDTEVVDVKVESIMSRQRTSSNAEALTEVGKAAAAVFRFPERSVERRHAMEALERRVGAAGLL